MLKDNLLKLCEKIFEAWCGHLGFQNGRHLYKIFGFIKVKYLFLQKQNAKSPDSWYITL